MATVEIPAVLGEVDPRRFRNKRVRIVKGDGFYDVQILEPDMSFAEMLELRIPVAPSEMREARDREYANIGVSATMTTTIEGKDYLVLAPAITGEMVKLISGYVPTENLPFPEKALDTEVSEEFLPWTADGMVVRGGYEDLQLPRPYADVLVDVPFTFKLERVSRFTLPGLLEGLVHVEGRVVEGEPFLYFLAGTNSAQLVFPLHVTFPFGTSDLSFHLAEDYLVREREVLEVRARPYGIRLACLGDLGELTGDVYSLREGVLVPEHVEGMVLSEVFGLRGLESRGVTEVKNIPLREYLELQRRFRFPSFCVG